MDRNTAASLGFETPRLTAYVGFERNFRLDGRSFFRRDGDAWTFVTYAPQDDMTLEQVVRWYRADRGD